MSASHVSQVRGGSYRRGFEPTTSTTTERICNWRNQKRSWRHRLQTKHILQENPIERFRAKSWLVNARVVRANGTLSISKTRCGTSYNQHQVTSLIATVCVRDVHIPHNHINHISAWGTHDEFCPGTLQKILLQNVKINV